MQRAGQIATPRDGGCQPNRSWIDRLENLAIMIYAWPVLSMDAIISLVKATAWPITVLIVAWWFRIELKELFGRVKKIGREGAEFDVPQHLPVGGDPVAPAPAPLLSPPSGPAQSVADRPSPEALIPPVIRGLYSQLAFRFRDRITQLQTLVSGSEADLAIAMAAETAAALQLERASRSVFQSQVDALEELKWHTTSKSAFRPYYDRATQTKPDFYAGYSFDQWFNFLVQFGLVEGPDNTINVTPAGEALKMYMAQQGYKPIAA